MAQIHVAKKCNKNPPGREVNILPTRRVHIHMRVHMQAQSSQIIQRPNTTGSDRPLLLTYCLQALSTHNLNVQVLSRRHPRSRISSNLLTRTDILHLMNRGTRLIRRNEPHERNAALLSVLNLLTELRRIRRHLAGDTAGAQCIRNIVRLNLTLFI